MDQGGFTFLPNPSQLSQPQMQPDGSHQFLLNAYTNRNYIIEFSTNTFDWTYLRSSFQTNDPALVSDPAATNSLIRLYRARLAP